MWETTLGNAKRGGYEQYSTRGAWCALVAMAGETLQDYLHSPRGQRRMSVYIENGHCLPYSY